jgi:hypothetical protein
MVLGGAVSITQGIYYKSQPHFETHDMREYFYFIRFNSDVVVELYQGEHENGKGFVKLETGSCKKIDDRLIVDFGPYRPTMTARAGHNETVIFDVQQSGPMIYDDVEIFTRIDAWKRLKKHINLTPLYMFGG